MKREKSVIMSGNVRERKPEMSKITENDEKLISKLKELPLDYWYFREDYTKKYTHGLHNYPAMMVCPISRNIIRMVKEIQPVNALLDPFAGSGTVLVEGMLSGIETVAGNDINPLALLLTKVKTTPIKHKILLEETKKLFDRTVKNKLLKTDMIINELAPLYGLTSIFTVDRNIPNKVMPSQNSPTNVSGATGSTMTMEHIIVLRKN